MTYKLELGLGRKLGLFIPEENIVDENKHNQGWQGAKQDIKDCQEIYHTLLLYTKGVSNNATEKIRTLTGQ